MSTTAKTVFKNVSFLTAGTIVSQVLRIIYIAMLARYVGATGLGHISTGAAVVTLLMLLVNFGLDTVLVRDTSADRTRAAKYVANVAFIRLLLTLVLAILLMLFLSQSPYAYLTNVIITLYALVYVLDALYAVVRSIFHAFQKMEYTAMIDLGRDFLNVSVSMLGIYLGWSLVAIVSVSAFANSVKLIASVIVMQRRFVRPALEIDLVLCRSLLMAAFPFFLLVCINVASTALVTLILSLIATVEAVGIYSAASTPVVTLLLLPSMFFMSIFPVFSERYQNSTAALRAAYRGSYKVLLLSGFPLGAGTMLVSTSAIALLYGPGFEEAGFVMNILAVQLFTMVGYVNGAFMNATHRQTLFAILRAASVALSVILCVAWIPKYSYTGAALAVAIPAVIDFILYSALCHHYLSLPLPWLTAVKVVVATTVMSAGSFFALNCGLSVFAVVPLAAAMYSVSLLALRAINAEEWQVVKEIVVIRRLRRAMAAH